LTIADRRTSLIDHQIVAGLFFGGVLPWFREDSLGLGVVRTHVNSRLAASDRLAGRPVRHAEYAAELFYSLRPASWLTLRPNLQWIHHAGGLSGAEDIGVIGLKTEVEF
jgi:porin